jgi:uncharacterized protein (DUF2236 family)
MRWMQTILIRASIDLIPAWIRKRLGLGRAYDLRRQERWLVELAGAVADRIVLPTSPAVQSCVRLGLPANYLYSQRRYVRS